MAGLVGSGNKAALAAGFWFTDYSELLTFASVLTEAGAFADPKGLLYFFEKPWKWETEHANWVKLGKPLEVDALADLEAP